MRIALIEISNFRGIKSLRWSPDAGINCLIGPGDSTKTTILDAIELCLNPRSYNFADDCDFYDLDFNNVIQVIVSLVDLPLEFKSEDRYGLYLRGWNPQTETMEDEPALCLEEALSIRVIIDLSLEAQWTIFSERLAEANNDSVGIRFRDAKLFATTRLGPYADRHLGWGRSSVLSRLEAKTGSVSLQLAQASRAARLAFRAGDQRLFEKAAQRAETLSKNFAVPVRQKYTAELDVESVSLSSGGITLHDGNLPLRRLGTGSSRLIVSALQHEAGPSHIALIDEIEHGLEPYRLTRLLKFLRDPSQRGAEKQPQIFLTTHSPVVVRELTAKDVFTVRSAVGVTTVRSVSKLANDFDTAQRHLRSSPEAFLAPKVLVCEGKTEHGLARGLDAWWVSKSKDSLALLGTVSVDGGGKDKAPLMAEHLLDLGYVACLLLDSDEPPNPDALARVKTKGGTVLQWLGNCSTEERLFLDLPWEGVCKTVELAREFVGDDSVLAVINKELSSAELLAINNLELPSTYDNEPFRKALGKAAKNKKRPWFKDIYRGEQLATVVGSWLEKIPAAPLTKVLTELRAWIDG